MRHFFAAVAIAALAATTVPAHAVNWTSPWLNSSAINGTADYSGTYWGWTLGATNNVLNTVGSSGSPIVFPPGTPSTGSIGLQSAPYAGLPNPPNSLQIIANYGGKVVVHSSTFKATAFDTYVGGWYRWDTGNQAYTPNPTSPPSAVVTQAGSIHVQHETAPNTWTDIYTNDFVLPAEDTDTGWINWITSTPTVVGDNYRVEWDWSKPKAKLIGGSYSSNQAYLQIDGKGAEQTPEPASMVMLGLGISGFLAARRRKKAAKA